MKRSLLVGIVLLFFASSTIAQIEKVDSLIQAHYKAKQFEGTLVIGNIDSVIYSNAIGTANRVWDIPMESHHRLDIASLNKSFIAALVLLYAQDNKLSLQDQLSIHLPEFDAQHKNEITIHQLLTHTSGLADYNQMPDSLTKNNFLLAKRLHFTTADKYVHFINQLAPVDEPGARFYYSNFGYHLLALMLEKITGQPFAQILEERITIPLQLKNTHSPRTNEIVYKHVAEAYNWTSDNGYERNLYLDLTFGRRIYSTSTDLYKWAVALCSNVLLNEKSRKLMFTNHLKEFDNQSYGYGWVIQDGSNYPMGNIAIEKPYAIHGGATDGFKSMLTIINGGEYIITHLSNVGDRTNEIELTQKIAELLINK